jgi:hypothetical protein
VQDVMLLSLNVCFYVAQYGNQIRETLECIGSRNNSIGLPM